MLDWTSASSLMEEVRLAEQFRDEHLSTWPDRVKRYAGGAYRSTWREQREPENVVHEFVALVLPKLVHDNPRARVTVSRPAQAARIGERLQLALNQWSKMTRVRHALKRVALDSLLGMGVAMVVSEPRRKARDGEQEPWLPRVYRISPTNFLIDPACEHWTDARWLGHCHITDIEALKRRALDEDGWNEAAIASLAEDAEVEGKRWAAGEVPTRREVVVYELWVPEQQSKAEKADPSKFAGTIFTLAYGQANDAKGARKVEFIREPQPFRGPRTGPYVVAGSYDVPDDPYPLGPLQPADDEVCEYNGTLRQMSAGARRYKRIIVGDSKSRKALQDVVDNPDLFVTTVENLVADLIKTYEVGGISAQQVEYARIVRERIDRLTGVNDVMRGNVTGQASATEVAVAESSSAGRIAQVQREFVEFVSQVLTGVAWHLWHDERVNFPMGREAAKRLVESDPVWTGGVNAGEFDELLVDLEAWSMERVSEALLQRRALELLRIVGIVGQGMAQMPWVKWGELLDVVGNAFNQPGLGDLIDTQMLQQITQAAARQGGGQQQGGASGGSGGGAVRPGGESSPIPASARGGLAAARR